MPFTFDNIANVQRRIVSGDVTARAVVESALDAAVRLNDTLNAFLQIDRSGALQRANEIDEQLIAQAQPAQPQPA